MRAGLRCPARWATGGRWSLAAALLLTACAPPPPLLGTKLLPRTLSGTDGASHTLPPDGSARLTVLVFFDDHCPCQTAHDRRLRELYALYHPRGVDFLAVDSQRGASVERDRAEAEKRGYPFPLLVDPGGSLARSMGADYATETFVLGPGGTIRYHGGIDSDRTHLEESAIPYLRDALEDLLADRPPRRAESKALGCALETR
jgi:peroxiredoxin